MLPTQNKKLSFQSPPHLCYTPRKNHLMECVSMNMLGYIKQKIKKRKLKKTFKEYGFKINKFPIEGIGDVTYAQWQHPFESPKTITQSNINFYKSLVDEGAFIIDIGAHTGDTTVPMALAVGAKGLVLGLEPNQYVYKVLEKNAQLNPELTNIIPLPYAATSHKGSFTFNYSDASFCNGGFLSSIATKKHHHNYTLNVEGVNLQQYLFEHYAEDLPRLQLIKIDAEGYDKEILKTLPTILREYKPKLMVECYKKLNDEERFELFDLLSHERYTLYYLENFEEKGQRQRILREDMLKKRHFEILALSSI